jgi:hypothetical protein
MRVYTTQDVINSGCNLTPIECYYCKSLEVTFHQYIGDGHCGECGEYQNENLLKCPTCEESTYIKNEGCLDGNCVEFEILKNKEEE